MEHLDHWEIGESVYIIHEGYIYKMEVCGVRKVNDYTYRYYVANRLLGKNVSDREVFSSVEHLIENLKSVILE